ncbi:hypothetical protein Tsubulata_027357, partial [Turnera subulata]
LTSLLRLQNDPKLALELFRNPNPNPNPKQANPQRPFRYSLSSYDILISKLSRAKMFREMEGILLQLKSETRFVAREPLFCNIITSYGRARLPDKARKLFDEIPSFRCERTVKSYNTLLNAFFLCKEYHKMRDFFVDIVRSVKPDACTYNILIRGMCATGRVDDARKMFDGMPKRGVTPTVVTFGNLIHGYCSDLRVKEGFRLKSDMVRGKNEDLFWSVFDCLGRGNVIDVATWRLAIVKALKEDKLSSACPLLDSLQQFT